MGKLQQQLSKLCALMHADEVVLFEVATFLVISSAESEEHKHPDEHRYEKVSNIIKQFKLSCSKTQSSFKSLVVRNKNFSAYMDVFTPNTYLMAIMTGDRVQPAATALTLAAARPLFERLASGQ